MTSSIHPTLTSLFRHISSSTIHPSLLTSHLRHISTRSPMISRKIRNTFLPWWKRQSTMLKSFLCILAGFFSFILLRLLFIEPDSFFIASESAHALGIAILPYKLHSTRNCTGLSLKSQELTAIFLAIRLYCSFALEYNIHTILDTMALLATCWAIYMIRIDLKHVDRSDPDNLPMHYLVIPCAVLACIIHPRTAHFVLNSMLWAFCVYLEAVSVLPQLHAMRNVKYVEPFTMHYVFALGVARLLSFTHWMCEVVEMRGQMVVTVGCGVWWTMMVIVAEVVQTGILAGFCYYYVKCMVDGRLVMSQTKPTRSTVRCIWCDSPKHSRSKCKDHQEAIQKNIIFYENGLAHSSITRQPLKPNIGKGGMMKMVENVGQGHSKTIFHK